MYISLTHSVDEKKGKVSVLLLFESKLLWKLSLDDISLVTLNTSLDSHGLVLTSPSSSQTSDSDVISKPGKLV